MTAPRDEVLEHLLAERERTCSMFVAVGIPGILQTMMDVAAALEVNDVLLRDRLLSLGVVAKSARELTVKEIQESLRHRLGHMLVVEHKTNA